MKAFLLEETGSFSRDRLRKVEGPRPEPSEGEALIQVKACGVCHTDLHLIEGDIVPGTCPVIPGHQVVGRIVRLNGSREDISEGDRVGVPWLHRTCGTCRDCRNGRENLCRDADFTGCDEDGGYAEYMTAPLDFIHPIPDDLGTRETPPLLCGGAVGYRAYRLSEAEPGDRLGLYGFGSSASMVIQAAVDHGNECYVFTRSRKHMELAEDLGAAWTGRAEEDPGVEMHSSILFAPAGPLVLRSLEQLRQGGTLAIAGIYLSPIPEMDYEKHLFRERTVRSVTASTREDIRIFLEKARSIPVETRTESFAFDELPAALERVKKSEHNISPVISVS